MPYPPMAYGLLHQTTGPTLSGTAACMSWHGMDSPLGPGPRPLRLWPARTYQIRAQTAREAVPRPPHTLKPTFVPTSYAPAYRSLAFVPAAPQPVFRRSEFHLAKTQVTNRPQTMARTGFLGTLNVQARTNNEETMQDRRDYQQWRETQGAEALYKTQLPGHRLTGELPEDIVPIPRPVPFVDWPLDRRNEESFYTKSQMLSTTRQMLGDTETIDNSDANPDAQVYDDSCASSSADTTARRHYPAYTVAQVRASVLGNERVVINKRGREQKVIRDRLWKPRV